MAVTDLHAGLIAQIYTTRIQAAVQIVLVVKVLHVALLAIKHWSKYVKLYMNLCDASVSAMAWLGTLRCKRCHVVTVCILHHIIWYTSTTLKNELAYSAANSRRLSILFLSKPHGQSKVQEVIPTLTLKHYASKLISNPMGLRASIAFLFKVFFLTFSPTPGFSNEGPPGW